MKQTPLHSLHRELGAKFGPFAGFDMPLFYPAGILAEHRHTRAQCGLFDISHMMQVVIDGPGAPALVSRLCPYPAEEQKPGRARYSFFLNGEAGIIDDLIVTRLGESRFMIVCNAGCADKDLAHIQDHASQFDVDVTVRERAFIAVQGPQAEAVLAGAGLSGLPQRFLDAVEMPGDRFISRSGYTGEDGFEIALPAGEAEEFARKLLSDSRAMMIGLGARDSLRLEAGLPLYGQDLGEDITPMEAGLAWAIPQGHRHGGGFVGALALASHFAQGRKRKRIAFVPEGNAPVRAHSTVLDAEGSKAGEVTSGGFGPTVNHPVGMALVNIDAGDTLLADLRGRNIPLRQVKLPFVPHRYKQ